MNYLPDKLTFKCNACGHRYEDAFYCEHCKAPMCPACKRTGSVTNVVEMQRMVSHSVTLRSQMKNSKTKKNKPRKNQADKIAALMRMTE